ncbi:unnamed protein product [Calypogeia fissa]
MFTSVETILKGTFGYMDPEYFNFNRLTQKSDVYSFGVVLMEIISGRHPYVVELPDGTSGALIQWVRSAVTYGSPMDIVDPSLDCREFNKDSMMKVITLAIGCTDPQTARRPDVGHVVRALIEAIQLDPSSKAILNTHMGETYELDAVGEDPELGDSGEDSETDLESLIGSTITISQGSPK